MKEFTSSIGNIVDALRQAKEDPEIGCSLLIGAGCSVSAGIPTGQGFVNIIKDKWPNNYEKASKKPYPHCMAKLSGGFQRKLIKDEIKDAKINWAHICIAILLKENYVDRVLTTNFDPLISRACALLGQFPAIYDFAASQNFKPEYVHDKAIFHLHGQHTGFVMLHDETETKRLSESLKPVFKDASQGRLWIVVGYSGECDPVFDDHLSEVESFDFNLYWVGYQDSPPSEHVQKKLLQKDKNAYHIPGHDADSFFIELTRKLDIFPPELFTKPFHHLNRVFDDIKAFPSLKDFTERDVTETAREQIRQAMKQAEANNQDLLAEANRLLLSGDDNATLEFIEKSKHVARDIDFSEIESSAYNVQGINLGELAETQKGKLKQETLQLAIEKFEQAIKLKNDNHQAFNSWATALIFLGLTKNGKAKQKSLLLAGEKCQQALKIKPDKHEAFYNWGCALAGLALTQNGKPQQNSFQKACDKFQKSLKFNKDDHDALFNLSCLEALLGNEAKCKKWLKKVIAIAPLTKEKMNYTDLDSVRDKAWFKKLVS